MTLRIKLPQTRRFILAQFCGFEGSHGANVFDVDAVFTYGDEIIRITLTEDQFKVLKTCKVGKLVKINRP